VTLASLSVVRFTTAACAAESAVSGASSTSEIQVTGTRVQERVAQLPFSVTLITADDLRARGATDLRTALALVAGTDAPPGGDVGPAGAVPSLWGLHEFDAFLLVVDGVPWGGVFNPALPALDLHDVERIEILKGPAPVMYGATSFVGVIQVLRRVAGSSDGRADFSSSSYGSRGASVSTALPSIGEFRESLLLSGSRTRLSDSRAGFDSGHLLYRSSFPVAAGTATADAEFIGTSQLPTSPVVREGDALTSTVTGPDANFNPSDAAIDERRAHFTVSYAQRFDGGEWHLLASYTHSHVHDVRGFVRPELTQGADGNNADGFGQERAIDDGYFDMYGVFRLAPSLSSIVGIDWLYGYASQASSNFAYFASLDGSAPLPRSDELHVDEVNTVRNQRNFGGLYSQMEWRATPRLDVVLGVRLNRTSEEQTSIHIDRNDASNDLGLPGSAYHVRPSGAVGVSIIAWGTPASEQGVVFADFRDTFKPSAIDFGPDFTPSVLEPEMAQSLELGIRAKSNGGALTWGVEAFRLDFSNLVLSGTAADGAPVLRNAGREYFHGIEGEVRATLSPQLAVSATCSYHDSRFGRAVGLEMGNLVDLTGHQLELAPHQMAAIGVEASPWPAVHAALQGAYIGQRFLDRLNTAAVGGYVSWDARLSYRLQRVEAALSGYNLSDRRVPVTASEFGDQSFYLMTARRLLFEVSWKL
jgi:iron complex outermembrane receptor protein